MVVLDGEPAVPCNLQSAIAGSITERRYDLDRPGFEGSGVEGWVRYRYMLQTPSGPEGSSGKRWYV